MKRQKARNYDKSNYYQQLSGKHSDESGDETELFVRNKPQFFEIPVVEKVVEDGDTLQALSIKYRCSIADLKRLNNIHKENEIYAKRTIKVPNRPFTTLLAGVHASGTSSPEESSSLRKDIDVDSVNSKLNVTLLNIPSSENSEANLNNIIFNSSISPKLCDNNEQEEASDEEVHLLPPSETIEEPVPVVAKISCSGADGDIPWIALIICIVILVFAVPLIYVLYIYEHPWLYHHNHTAS